MKIQCAARLVCSTVAPVLAVACSGGGGGGTPVPGAPAPITADNSSQVAAAMPMALELADFQDVMGFETLTAEGTGTEPCPSGGTATAGFQVDAPPVGEVSTGDRFAVTFSNCMLDGSSVLNGSIVIDFNTIDGDWELDDTWEVDIDFSINSLTFSSGAASGFFDGGWSQNASYDMGDSSYSLTGEFTTTVNDGTTVVSAALTDVTLTCDYDSGAGQASYTVAGQFASSELGGSITLTTLTPIVVSDGALNPEAGVLRATGTASSRLTCTVLDQTFIQLDVDEDGDGVDEFQATTTWSELDG